MTNTNKKIVAGLAATTLIAISFGSTYAMGNGQGGQGQGKGIGKMISAEEKAELQSMNDSEKQEYVKELKSKYNVTTGSTMEHEPSSENESYENESYYTVDTTTSFNTTVYNSYKSTIETKYGDLINAMSDDKLLLLIEKIDTLSETIKNSSQYSIATKEEYN